ncbi:hypothetical protein FXO38_08385 [Capsicum annuum]|nr:hypothetical protein FXO37_10015 [Capsicum annuum]KAF3667857.1 hypothetical protein FXO38_08385 [Capsicum annuum]
MGNSLSSPNNEFIDSAMFDAIILICGLKHVTVGIEDCIPMLVCPPNQVLGNPHGCIHLSITDQDTQFRKELIGHNPCRRAFAIGESILEIFTEDESSFATGETYVATDYTFVATDDEPVGTEYRFCCNSCGRPVLEEKTVNMGVNVDRNIFWEGQTYKVIEQILEAEIAEPSKIKRLRQKKKRILDVETTLLRHNASLNEVSTYENAHSCSVDFITSDHKNTTSKVICNYILEPVRDSSNVITPNFMVDEMRRKYRIIISYNKGWRVIQYTYKVIRGTAEENYNRLSSYLHMMKNNNPGTYTNLKRDGENRFQYEFFAYGTSIIGWTNCRSIIMVYGIFLKAKYHGVLMIAVSKDGNNNIFPLAFGIADSKNNESYNWFFNQLRHVIEASKSSKQEEGWVVCRVFKKKNYHKALESPQNSSAALSRSTIIQKPNNDGVLDQILMYAQSFILNMSFKVLFCFMLKLVMHNWSNEDCVKILKRYREASTYNDEGRKEKVLIIDMVLNRDEDEANMTEVKLLFDVLMMVILARGGGAEN